MTARVFHLLLIVLVLGVAGCDQATKGWAEGELEGRPPSTLVAGRLDLDYAQNRGIAFNLERVLPAPAQKPLIVFFGLAIVSVIAIAWWRRRGELSAETAAYALVLGGAIGNLLDRATRGYVVDFVHLHGWPVFNVADVAVAAGGVLYFISRWRSSSSRSTPRPAG